MNRNGVTIMLVDDKRVRGHSFRDYGLWIQNTDYIGDPVLFTQYVTIPGRSSYLDLSEVIAGRPIYESRHIKIQLAGFKEGFFWDNFMSTMRNTYSGKLVMLIFDNDPAWYWIGRAELTGFQRERSKGAFTLSLPHADPYKYYYQATNEPWKWDPFSFVDGVITDLSNQAVSGTTVIGIPQSDAPVVPEIIVSSVTGSLTISANGKRHTVTAAGTYYWPDFILYSNYDSIRFEGTATVSVSYRKGSL